MAAVALWLRRSVKNQAQLRDVEIDRRLRGRSEMEAELVDAELRTKAELTSLGLPDLAAAEDLLAREDAHIAQIDLLGAQLDGLVGKEPPSSLVDHARHGGPRHRAADERARGARADRQGAPRPRAPRGRGPRPGEGRSRAPATTRRTRAPGSKPTPSTPNRSPARPNGSSRGRSSSPRPSAASASSRITLEAIDRAEQATMKSATRYLETHMGGSLAAVTDGRYRRVRVDDKTLDIEVHAPEKDDWVPVTSLSQGTLDLVYLVARLGLVRLVTGDRRPPLIFDDPFVTLDDARAGRALTLLKGIAVRLPGHLHDHVVALRRGRRCGGRARRADQRRRRGGRGRRRRRAGAVDRPAPCRRSRLPPHGRA